MEGLSREGFVWGRGCVVRACLGRVCLERVCLGGVCHGECLSAKGFRGGGYVSVPSTLNARIQEMSRNLTKPGR